MIRKSTLFFRAISFTVVFGLVNLSMPAGAINTIGTPLRQGVQAKLARMGADREEIAKRRAKSASRPLSQKEQMNMQGRSGENPYLAGSSKFDVSADGISVFSGNFSTSATDMSFDGGYGIPVNVTRSYSANNADEGPFGKGWSLSADVRSTAGGLLKSKSAPVRSVPVAIKERPSTQLDDPNAELANGTATQPAAAVVATDAGGMEETIQKDLDGILTTPPWDKNTSDPTYEWVSLGSSTYQVLVSNKVTTPDGTVYVYSKHGYYPNGTVPWNDTSATPEAANVLKVDTATDRQGNVTTYTYGAFDPVATDPLLSSEVQFSKSNGTVREGKLLSVQMPNGHQISFTWGDGSAGHPTNRTRSISDNGEARTVHYGYTNGLLTSVTTPGGKTTTYAYGAPYVRSGWTGDVASNLLTGITDPRGLTTGIRYAMNENCVVLPAVVPVSGAFAYRVDHPDGTFVFVQRMQLGYGETTLPGAFWADQAGQNIVVRGDSGGHQVGAWWPTASVNSGVLTVENGSIPVYDGTPETFSRTQYDLVTGDQIYAFQEIVPKPIRTLSRYPDYLAPSRYLDRSSDHLTRTETYTTNNFLGNPLSKTSLESTSPDGATWTTTRQATVGYAYWGADKYYQQKATVDQAGRIAFTDYYDSSGKKPSYSGDNASYPGSKGQTYRVYDPKHGAWPTSLPSDWKYNLLPGTGAIHSAEFVYDAEGRPTDVYKLQIDGATPSYVRTHTEYGANNDGSWGQAAQVIEDYGGIARTTQTNGYKSWGKACDVTDAAGHRFVTSYDDDGNVLGVTCDGSAVVTYTYGTSGITNGQVTAVADGLSGVSQSISYVTSGAGLGQPATVTESRGGVSYSTTYEYDANGERTTAYYDTVDGQSKWQYAGYVALSDLSGKRVFQTMRQLLKVGTQWVPGTEEFHYAYDSSGRLLEATFAQTPRQTSASNGSWYGSLTAATRARAHYVYDSGGRLVELDTYWDAWNGSSYNSELVSQDACAYEIGGSMNRGLKTSSVQGLRTASGGTWVAEQNATYGYDAQLDYLTSATYGDGLPNASATWTYDAAGNRNDAVTDNLNRATSVGGVACTNDILGNRLTKGTASYAWDVLNRMTSYASGGITTSYAYRADGMRVSKSDSTGSAVYRYDGQMLMQDVETPTSGTATVTNYALGARGVDGVSKTENGTTSYGYPIYDAHGNRTATLTKNGTSFSLTDVRTYDAWGNVRVGATTGRPRARYCANLGHVQDDESNLIYMRARYYEPTSGRLLSQDPGRQGSNWFSFCGNNPVNRSDGDGKSWTDIVAGGLFAAGMMYAMFAVVTMWGETGIYSTEKYRFELATTAASMSSACYALGLMALQPSGMTAVVIKAVAAALVVFGATIAVMTLGMETGAKTRAGTVAAASYAYGLLLVGALVAIDAEAALG